MNLKQIEKILTDSGIEPSEAKIEAKMLVKHFCKLSDIDLIMSDEFEAPEILLEKAKFRAKKRVPIQHIIGTAYFMGEDFIVNEHVLIPRDETEILVREAIEIIKQNDFRKILDIGTGSGCIACTIAKNTKAQVIGVDISTDALQIALDNSSKLGLFNKAIFRKSDLFSNVKEKFDLIVSNPPYIPISQQQGIQQEVQFEPASALYANDINGIEFYDKIIKESADFLNSNGCLMFEIGQGQATLVKELMEQNFYIDIKIIKDLANIDRVIYGRKNG